MIIFKFIGEIFRKYSLLLTIVTLLVVLMASMEVASIITLAPVVDILTHPDLKGVSSITQSIIEVMRSIGIPVGLFSVLVIFLAFNAFKSGLTIWVEQSILKIKYAMVRDIVLETLNCFFRARWYFFSSGKQGTLINTFTREMTVVGDAFGGMGRFFAMTIQILIYFAIPFYISWQVTSICLAIAILFALPLLMLGKISIRLGRQNTATANQMSAVIQEGLSSAKIILGFGNQRMLSKNWASAFDAHRKVTIKSQTLGVAIPQIYMPFSLVVLIVALFMAQRLVIPLSETAVLLYSLLRVIPMIGQFASEKQRIDNFFPSYEQVINLRQRARELEQPTGDIIFTELENEIAIEGLSFAYPSHEPVLVNINARIPKGKMISFVGESGAGKSTLIDMIMGFNESVIGQITVDGTPLQEFDINSYRKRIGYVPQESILFNMTIADNLRWANEAATDKEIKEACIQANAYEFIQGFPEGYNTLVGDRGVRLSGGQIQRIALARAIIRNPSLLILDEATSSLDTHSERLIQEAIEKIAQETTVIVIAHRLSTIVNADYVYVLKKGRIVEEGTYSQLYSMNGYFKDMVESQALGVENSIASDLEVGRA